MDRIRPSQASVLIDALRKLSKSKEAPASDASNAGSATGRSTLREELSELVAETDLNNEAELRSIQSAVLRCILRHEWGTAAESDGAFTGIVAAVNEMIAQDHRLTDVVRAALQSIQKAH